MAYDSKNPKKNSLILLDESGTPANPPAGSTKLITRSGLLYHRNSAGTETAVLTGAAATQYSAKSASYPITDTDNIRTVGMTTGSTDRTVTLPTAADNTHRIITVKKVDSGTGTVTVDGENSETIDGALTLVLGAQYDEVTMQCDGSNWHIIESYAKAYKENNRSSNTPNFTSNTYTSIDTGNSTFNDDGETGIALTPGEWEIRGSCIVNSANGAMITQALLFIGTAKGASTTGIVGSKNEDLSANALSVNASIGLQTPIWRVSISANTTYYLKCRVIFTDGDGGSAATANAVGNISARQLSFV